MEIASIGTERDLDAEQAAMDADDGRGTRHAREAEEAEAEGVAVGEGGEDAEGKGEGEEGLPPLQLEGLGSGQLSLRIGGPRPDVATAKLVGAKIELPEGEFQPGDIINATVRLRCTKVSIIDKVNNSTGDVNEREREHIFRTLAIERVS